MNTSALLARALRHQAVTARRLTRETSRLQSSIRLVDERAKIHRIMASRDMLCRKVVKANAAIRALLGTSPDCGIGIDRDCYCPDCVGDLSPFVK